MARGLFLIIPGHGHVNPTIGLVKELISKGDEIVYITTNNFRDKFENLDVKFVGYSEEAFIRFNNTNGNDSAIGMVTKFLEINKLTLELAMEQTGEFDYLVVDNFIHADRRLIEKFNIKKVIATITTFALNDNLISLLYSDLNSDKGLVQAFTSLLGQDDKAKLDPSYNPIVDVIGKKSADLKLVFTSKHYQPYSESFDDSFKFVGPSITNRDEFQELHIQKPLNKRLIYISLGTVADGNISFYKKCIEALGSKDDLIVVMSIGNRIKRQDLGVIPENFKVIDYVSQFKLLKQVDLFITHGGMNSSTEGLYNGIPLIVVPQFGDQALIAKRIHELGAGIPLVNDIDSKSIENEVYKILMDKSYKENAMKIGESLKSCGGYKEAANLIHEIL